jgi:hypothetical protein
MCLRGKALGVEHLHARNVAVARHLLQIDRVAGHVGALPHIDDRAGFARIRIQYGAYLRGLWPSRIRCVNRQNNRPDPGQLTWLETQDWYRFGILMVQQPTALDRFKQRMSWRNTAITQNKSALCISAQRMLTGLKRRAGLFVKTAVDTQLPAPAHNSILANG